jgi:hypothetical protein
VARLAAPLSFLGPLQLFLNMLTFLSLASAIETAPCLKSWERKFGGE